MSTGLANRRTKPAMRSLQTLFIVGKLVFLRVTAGDRKRHKMTYNDATADTKLTQDLIR